MVIYKLVQGTVDIPVTAEELLVFMLEFRIGKNDVYTGRSANPFTMHSGSLFVSIKRADSIG